MHKYQVIALIAVLVIFAPMGIASAQVDNALQQQGSEQRQQAEERKKESERRRELEKRQDAERRQDAEHKHEMEQRHGAERRQDAERRRDTEQRQEVERRQNTERRQDNAARSMAPGQIRADELVGQEVISRKNNKGVGKVSGIVIDEAGQIEAAVIEHGGFLGFFTSEVSVPWNQLELSEDGTTIITYLDRKQIRNATAYKRN